MRRQPRSSILVGAIAIFAVAVGRAPSQISAGASAPPPRPGVHAARIPAAQSILGSSPRSVNLQRLWATSRGSRESSSAARSGSRKAPRSFHSARQNGVNTRNGPPAAVRIDPGSNSRLPLKLSSETPLAWSRASRPGFRGQRRRARTPDCRRCAAPPFLCRQLQQRFRGRPRCA